MSAAVKIGAVALTERQRELLSGVTVEGNVARFTGARIPDWKQLKTVMEALGSTWQRGPQGFVFPREVDGAGLVDAARGSGEIIDPKEAELFETPSKLADELVAQAGVRPGHRVLEPSAGRGSLLRAIDRALRKSKGTAETVAVEVLQTCCDSLTRQGYAHRSVDFMECVTADLGGLFDRIVMNPPFSRHKDIAHVQHAMKFLKPGGVLVSVMSAGVKFREDRTAKDFRAYVAALGGTITDLPEGSFSEAGTMVRTVVVRLVQPGVVEPEPEPEPEIIVESSSAELAVASPYGAEWQAAAEAAAEPQSHAEANPFQTDELAIPKNVVELVRAFRRAEADLRAGFVLVTKCQEGLRAAFSDDRFTVRDKHSRDTLDYYQPDVVLTELRRSAWRSLVSRLELQRFMSSKAWKALDEKIDRTEPPEITEENVIGLAKQYRDQFEDMVRESVREVFDFLRPHHSELKTNQKVKWQVGRKVILGSWIEAGFGGGFRPGYYYSQNMTSLENVFSNLDGQGFANKSLNRSLLAQAIETSKDGRGETAYFKFKCFGNRNLHLEFKRMDLVDRLNLIAGGGALKPKAEHQ